MHTLPLASRPRHDGPSPGGAAIAALAGAEHCPLCELESAGPCPACNGAGYVWYDVG